MPFNLVSMSAFMEDLAWLSFNYKYMQCTYTCNLYNKITTARTQEHTYMIVHVATFTSSQRLLSCWESSLVTLSEPAELARWPLKEASTNVCISASALRWCDFNFWMLFISFNVANLRLLCLSCSSSWSTCSLSCSPQLLWTLTGEGWVWKWTDCWGLLQRLLCWSLDLSNFDRSCIGICTHV